MCSDSKAVMKYWFEYKGGVFMKRITVLISAALLMTAFLAACGGKQEAAPPATSAAAQTTEAAKETTAAETEKAADDLSPEAEKLLSKEDFLAFFDMLLEDAEDPDAFWAEYKGEKYKKAELGKLYEALAKDGGKGTVNLAGEAEEELDFKSIAEMMGALNSAYSAGADTDTETEEDDGWSDSDTAVYSLTKDQFYEYFDMVIKDSEIPQDDFFVTYGGRRYYYEDLGDLYDAADAEGGTIDVGLMGEEEEMLDLEIIQNQLEFYSSWNSTSSGSWDDDNAPDQELIDRFYGDWHGVVQFQNCTGKYEASLGDEWVNSIARIYIDSDGYVIPFIGLNVEDTPIEGLEAELDTEDECLYLSGSWISVPFEHIPMTEKDGTLHCEIPISKEAGSLTMVFNLRHLNDIHWEGIDPALPEDYIVHCQGWTFDQLAEANGYTSWDYVQYSAGEEPEYPVQIAQEEEKEDFGKTTEDADGIVSKSKLQSGYNKIMDEMDKSGHDPITYEKVRDWFGADGKKTSPAQWNEGNHKYEWATEDGKDWVTISFTVYTDGSERLNTVNQSDAILNGR